MPESLLIPTPLMRKVAKEDREMIVNALAPAWKSMPFSVTLDERETLVTLEASKVATSDRPLGTVAGVQFMAVFQLLDAGSRFQVALPARAVPLARNKKAALKSGARRRSLDWFMD